MGTTKSKYNSKKVVFEGITFDSILEKTFYENLLEVKSSITRLIIQPKFELQPAFKHNGETVRKIEYVADFQYEDENGVHVIDIKGQILPLFALKEKMFKFKYPHLKLTLLGKCPVYAKKYNPFFLENFIELDDLKRLRKEKKAGKL